MLLVHERDSQFSVCPQTADYTHSLTRCPHRESSNTFENDLPIDRESCKNYVTCVPSSVDVHAERRLPDLTGRQQSRHRSRNRPHRDKQDRVATDSFLSPHASSLSLHEED